MLSKQFTLTSADFEGGRIALVQNRLLLHQDVSFAGVYIGVSGVSGCHKIIF